jgi:glucose-1-phosphate adenylyltransferase
MPSDSIKLPRMVAMILAGGRVGELSVLTLRRPKSALPFGGYYRVIDFALTNLMRAGINNVGILSQYRPGSLIDHVGIGESWDFTGLDRGAKILPPFRGAEASDWYKGNADAVYQNLNYIRDHKAEIVLILSGDHIYTMDYRDLQGRLASYEEKPTRRSSDLASLTIYVVNAVALVETLSQLSGRPQVEFGADVIPLMLDEYRVYGYEFTGYWAYTRNVAAYYQAHQDLLSHRIDLDEWGVRTNLNDSAVSNQAPPRVLRGAQVRNSFVSAGARVEGTVIGSILSPAVRVEKGAVVRNSILFHRAVVERGAIVNLTIADKQVSIGSGARVGPPPEEAFDPQPGGVLPAPITLLGKQCRIAPGAVIKAGSEIPPEAVIV